MLFTPFFNNQPVKKFFYSYFHSNATPLTVFFPSRKKGVNGVNIIMEITHSTKQEEEFIFYSTITINMEC